MFGQRQRGFSRLVWVCGMNVLGSAACGGQSDNDERSAAASASDFDTDASEGEGASAQSESPGDVERPQNTEKSGGDDESAKESSAEQASAQLPSSDPADDMSAPGDAAREPETDKTDEAETDEAASDEANDKAANGDSATDEAATNKVTDGDPADGDPADGEEDVTEQEAATSGSDDESSSEVDEPADVDVPSDPPTLDDIVISSGDVAHPACDLGGGVPVVQACVAMPIGTDCTSLDFDVEDVMDIANSNYDCGHPWIAGIICGPAISQTSDVAECCWEMDGHCLEDQMLPSNPRELHPAEPGTLPAGCTGEGPDDSPDFPVVSGDFLVEPGDREQPLCDLGGGIPRARVCAPLISDVEGCHDLIVDTDVIFSTARENLTCDDSWGAGIACGPVRAELESGPACCWELDG